MNKVILIGMFLLIFFVKFSSAIDEIQINIEIDRRGPISKEYNVVGDTFSYKINLTNLGIEKIIEDFIVCVNTPYKNNCLTFNETEITPNETKSLIPIRPSGLISIYSFSSMGEYNINISSENIRFRKNYSIEKLSKRYAYFNVYDNVYIKYFDTMPRWQFELFKEESDAAQKALEANEKLLQLNIDLDKATQSMNTATWIIVAVAIISLFVIFNDYLGKKAERKSKRELGLTCLIKEIDHNIDLFEDVLKKERFYLKGGKVPFNDASTINFERALTSNYIEEDSLLEEIYDAYGFLKSLNNFLSRARIATKDVSLADIKKVIEILKEEKEGISNLKRLKNLKEKIGKKLNRNES